MTTTLKPKTCDRTAEGKRKDQLARTPASVKPPVDEHRRPGRPPRNEFPKRSTPRSRPFETTMDF